MKPLLMMVGVAGLLLGLIGSSEAQGDRVYSIAELTDEQVAMIDIKDGSIEDWLEVVGEPTLSAMDFYTVGRTLGDYDPASFDFRLWLGWHDGSNRLYVAVEQVDDVYINEYTDLNMQAHDSAVVFYVDGDNNNSGLEEFQILSFSLTEEELLANNQQAQVYTAIAEVLGDFPPVELQRTSYYDDWSVKPPYADAGGASAGELPTVAVTEFYVTPFDFLVWNSPEKSVVSDLYPGKTIGFMIALTDFDTISDDPFERAEAAFSLRSPDSSTFFVDGLLVGAGSSNDNDTAVEDITWARIKAGFR